MHDILTVGNVLGRLLTVFSLVYLLPIASAVYFGDGTLATFASSLTACLVTGLLLERVTRRFRRALMPRDGFVSVDYAQWPIFVPFWMLFLSSVTASSGSTGGGIKMFRTLVLAHQSSRELAHLTHPP